VRGQAVSPHAQPARWVLRFVAGRLREVPPFEWLPGVRDGQAMTQSGRLKPDLLASRVSGGLHQILPGLAGGSGRDWRQLAGVAS